VRTLSLHKGGTYSFRRVKGESEKRGAISNHRDEFYRDVSEFSPYHRGLVRRSEVSADVRGRLKGAGKSDERSGLMISSGADFGLDTFRAAKDPLLGSGVSYGAAELGLRESQCSPGGADAQ
jgi:hypothetical protein